MQFYHKRTELQDKERVITEIVGPLLATEDKTMTLHEENAL